MAIYSEQRVGKDSADSCSLWWVEKKQRYDIIKKNGIKYGYNIDSWGSIPIFTNVVINKSYQDITNKSIKSKVKYFKGIVYNFNTIKE